ncbi:hypothetical protein MPER_06088 [Moniliophthora perniciosa FA553]|nr:hypothetical protein MPER_06088 [Moniliophthora perniciosa FA553]
MGDDDATLILMLIPGVSAYRAGGKSQILRTIYRDGVVYYVLIFLASLVNVCAVLMLPVEFLHRYPILIFCIFIV